jgi:hypothetical protein
MEERVLTNLVYFKTNYFMIALAVFLWSLYVCMSSYSVVCRNYNVMAWECLTSLSSVGLLASFVVMVALWSYVFGVRTSPLVVGTRVLTPLEAFCATVGGLLDISLQERVCHVFICSCSVCQHLSWFWSCSRAFGSSFNWF